MLKVKFVPPPGTVVPDHTNLPCSESEAQNGKGQLAFWLPDHTDLPDKDDAPVTNSQEHPQSRLLTGSLEPLLRQRHPDGQYYIGQDTAIFYWIIQDTWAAAKVPDWFYVPDVRPLYKGALRRSYVLWYEQDAPLIALEYVSGDGSEERDQTPQTGKFWTYEKKLRIPYYGIYEVKPGRVEVYCLVGGKYELLPANDRGHFPIAPLGVELGIWQGHYAQYELPWLRWWDEQGKLIPSPEEREEQQRQRAEQEKQRAEQEKQRAEQEKQRAEQEKQRREQLEEKLRELGVDPDTI